MENTTMNAPMKTNSRQRPYTVSARNVVFDEDAIVKCRFKGSDHWIYEGPLGDLAGWLKGTDSKRRRNSDGTVEIVLGADILLECTTSEGRHGFYPILMAETDELAGALSVAVGFPVKTGDGATFWNRSQMLAVSNRISFSRRSDTGVGLSLRHHRACLCGQRGGHARAEVQVHCLPAGGRRCHGRSVLRPTVALIQTDTARHCIQACRVASTQI